LAGERDERNWLSRLEFEGTNSLRFSVDCGKKYTSCGLRNVLSSPTEQMEDVAAVLPGKGTSTDENEDKRFNG
jgi:hypothetical protein